jgi:hypothetical protein
MLTVEMQKPKPDYSAWPTKAQAADAIGVSTKTIEKLAFKRELQQALWHRPGGGPAIVVYHPGDVERLRKERNPDAAAFVMPAPADASGESPTTKAVAVRQPSAEAFMQALVAGLVGAGTSKTPDVRLAERLYLSLREAAEYTGLGTAHLHRLIASGKLKPLKGAGPRGADVVRRADLEKL